MRVYYICPRSVWEELIDFGGGWMLPAYNLFPHHIGSACIHLDDNGDWFLVSTDIPNEYAQDKWNSHPEVARLCHPTQEGNVPLAHLHQKPEYAHKQFTANHWNLLVQKFGLTENHNVWDLHDRAKAIDPLCRMTNVRY